MSQVHVSCVKDQEAQKRLQCPYCQLVLSNAVQLSCGHRLCQLCAEKVVKNSPPNCPHHDCEEEVTLEDGVYVNIQPSL